MVVWEHLPLGTVSVPFCYFNLHLPKMYVEIGKVFSCPSKYIFTFGDVCLHQIFYNFYLFILLYGTGDERKQMLMC